MTKIAQMEKNFLKNTCSNNDVEEEFNIGIIRRNFLIFNV